MKNNIWTERLNKILTLPQRHQRDALRILSRSFKPSDSETWNKRFDQDSLYESWSQILPMRNLYEVNKNVINKKLSELQNFTIVEIGGGNGALWRNLFNPNQKGTFILIDPTEESHEAVKKAIPSNIEFISIKKSVEELNQIPEADIIVCSLVLRFIPGTEKEENKKYGIDRIGKAQIIRKILESIRIKNGILIINETDVYTDIKIAPKTHFLFHSLIDSNIRRLAKSISFMMETEELTEDLFKKLELIIINWLFFMSKLHVIFQLKKELFMN